ncbi:hypothetical protein FP2506_04836 [Fulvimarina pelagi HTCC2506]|uniref:Uncharacterized protein n=2 Tax=Fulvimarina pelagi TaxID=217511 RepID=Q0FZR5_9HYPH|nr:hypothetical protein [Fulvimarina pelagi]EAU40526.1 hypothetical protein FP2506_04836 [Fulvimarina pelagi HTCC2506]BAT31551.1 hypothetical protein [Fulvimarina pelagi]
MLEKLLSLFAFVLLCVFLGFLIWHVPRLDLTLVLAFTVLLTGYDLFFHKPR